MREEEFREYYLERGFSDDDADHAIGAVKDLEEYLGARGGSLESVSVDGVKEYISSLISEDMNSRERLLAIARYFYLTKKNDVYIYFTSILGGRSVLPSISERLAQITGEEKRDIVFDSVETPPLGTPPEEFPAVTERLMDGLESELDKETWRKVLAGNHHRIPLESFEKHRRWYEEAGNLDEYLVRVHEGAIAELEEYLEEGKIWYEQEITPEVVEFVKGNQEVLSGIREGNRIYMTKFPYAPGEYLREEDPKMKRYYMCHCPFVRASILTGEPQISPEWCYCSGGYGKMKFDIVFGQETEVEVLETALGGDMRCRFAVKIPEGLCK